MCKENEEVEVEYDLDNHNDWASGTRVTLYLTPSDENDGRILISTFGFIGRCWPIAAHHGRMFELASVPADACADSLKKVLRTKEEDFRQIDACYQGTEFDGNNVVGRWSQDVASSSKMDRYDLTRLIEDEVERFSSASDYLSGSWRSQTLAGEIVEKGSLESFVEHEIERASQQGCRLDTGDLTKELTAMLQDHLDYHLAESRDPKERLLRLRIRRFLSAEAA